MNQIAFISGGGKLEYSAPVVDIINVCAENGFATSGVEFGGAGDSGLTGEGDNNFGVLDY